MLYAAQKYVSGSTLSEASLRIGLAALVVVSLSTNASGQSEQDGVCSAIAVPGALYTTAEGINNAGVVVGTYVTQDVGQFGYIYSGGQFTTLNAPNSLWTMAFGINDAGVVVGAYGPATPVCNCVADIEAHGFTYSNGAFTTFNVGLSQTIPLAINNAGQIVGYYHDRDGDIGDHSRGFLLSAGGGLTRIDGPGGGPLSEVLTVVRGINDAGVAVGYYGGGFTRGFTWRNGALTELRHPESPDYTGLYGIDNSRNDRRHLCWGRFRRWKLQARGQSIYAVRLHRLDRGAAPTAGARVRAASRRPEPRAPVCKAAASGPRISRR